MIFNQISFITRCMLSTNGFRRKCLWVEVDWDVVWQFSIRNVRSTLMMVSNFKLFVHIFRIYLKSMNFVQVTWLVFWISKSLKEIIEIPERRELRERPSVLTRPSPCSPAPLITGSIRFCSPLSRFVESFPKTVEQQR